MHPTSFRSTVAALAAGQLVCWAALYYGFTSFVLPMQGALGWSKPALMGAFTLGLAVWGAASYAVGAAIDRGHGRAVLTLGSALAGAGFWLWSAVQGLAGLYAAWALLGAAMAMTLYEPAFNLLTRRFPEHYRQGVTTLTLVGGFASTVSFPAVAWLLAALDWRDALRVIGSVLLLGVTPLHAVALRGTPEALVRAPQQQARDDATLREALRQRAFWLLALTFTLYSFASAALWAHMMPMFAARGLGETAALGIVVWFGPAQVAGRFAYLLFGRWIGTRTLGVMVLAGLPVSLAIFALGQGTLAWVMFALLFGLANGLVTIVRGSLVPEYFGRAHVGRISGTMNVVALLARAAAPLATAWLLLALPGYREVLMVLAGLGVVAVLAFAAARAPRR